MAYARPASVMPYHRHFVGQSSDLSSFLGALTGAFFAFVFGLIAYVITKRREAFVEHKNALVKLERVLNKHLEDIGALEMISKSMDTELGSGHTTSNRLVPLEIPDGLDMQVRSVELSNKLLTYQLSIDRLNLNVAMVNHALTRLEDLFINGQPVAVQNFNIVRGNLDKMRKDLVNFNSRTIRFLVLVRLHYKKLKGKNSFVYGVWNTQWEQNISNDEVKAEMEKLQTEIKAIMSEAPENLL